MAGAFCALSDVVAADFNATCQTQVKQAFGTLLGLAEDSKFQEIQEQLQLCSQPTTVTEVCALVPVNCFGVASSFRPCVCD